MTKASANRSAEQPATRILLVEDDSGLRRQMQWALEPYQAVPAGSAAEALRQFESAMPIVILDLGLPPDRDGASEGLKALDAILNRAPETKVIIVSGNADRAVALSAVERGAFDFISKPVEIDVLKLIVQRAMRMYELEKENRALRLNRDQRLPGIVYGSPAHGAHRAHHRARGAHRCQRRHSGRKRHRQGADRQRAAQDVSHAAMQGWWPSIAPRFRKTCSKANCSATSGAPSPAPSSRRWESSNSPTRARSSSTRSATCRFRLQAKVLRFLQSRQFERVGGRQTLSVDVRVISATNQPLAALVAEGKFREDLYYRLNEILIEMPPLREREGDAIILAQHFLNLYNRELSRNLRGFTEDALAALGAYNWPGNVRELENRVKRAVIMADGLLITPEDLELAASGKPRNLNLRDHVHQLESALLKEALAAGEGNVSKAAKLMGISRQQIYNLLAAQKQRV